MSAEYKDFSGSWFKQRMLGNTEEKSNTDGILGDMNHYYFFSVIHWRKVLIF